MCPFIVISEFSVGQQHYLWLEMMTKESANNSFDIWLEQMTQSKI